MHPLDVLLAHIAATPHPGVISIKRYDGAVVLVVTHSHEDGGLSWRSRPLTQREHVEARRDLVARATAAGARLVG
jgi:hypothetical protein